MKRQLSGVFILTLTIGLCLIFGQPVFSENVVPDETPVETNVGTVPDTEVPTPAENEPTVEPANTGSRFFSRQLLTQTLIAGLPEEDPADSDTGDEVSGGDDDQTAGDDTTTGGDDDQVAGDDTTTGGDDDQVAGDDSGVDQAEIPSQTPDERVAAFVESLSDEQVFALNRSLNNVVKSGLDIEYDMDLLEQIIENDYDKRQINALTKAMEEEAKFQALYEKTGDEKFLEKADSRKLKFLAKVDRFGNTTDIEDPGVEIQEMEMTAASLNSETGNVMRHSAKIAARDMSKQTAKLAAKGAAKETAKDAAKSAAKLAAKEAAKLAAKDAAKGAAKMAARDAAKNTAKQVAKATARETSKELRKEAKKENIKKENKGKGKGNS